LISALATTTAGKGEERENKRSEICELTCGTEGRGFKPRRSPQLLFAAYHLVTDRFFLIACRLHKAGLVHFFGHGGQRGFIQLVI